MNRQLLLDAECGNVKSMFMLALNYFTDGNYIMAFNWMKRSADLGYREALGELGKYYRFGIGTQIDLKNAVKYFKEGAKYGDEISLLQLAECYEQGIYVERNIKKSFRLWQQAAESGSPKGEYCLALCFSKGFGVNKNSDKARKHFSLALNDNCAKTGLNEVQSAYAKSFAGI